MSKISVIMPAFNSANFISEAINSVLNQTYESWELIIVDDCSTDNTLLLLETFNSIDSRIKIISNRVNSGNPGLARNVGIKYCSGDYIAFLDSDDIWEPRKLEIQLNFMKLNNFDLCFSRYECVDELGRSVKRNVIIPECITYRGLLKCNFIGLSTSIYNCNSIGKFYFKNFGHEDYVYWLDILRSGISAYGLNESLSFYRIRSTSVSSNKFKSASYTWNILYNYQKLGFIASSYYFINYVIIALFKRVS